MTDTEARHECKAFPQEDSDEVIIECALCGWGTTATEYKFVEALINAHYLTQIQWPYEDAVLKRPEGWPGT